MKPKLLPAMMLFVFLCTTWTNGQDQSAGQKPKPPTPAAVQSASSTNAPSAAEKYFSDVELINQDGQKVRFYSDVLKNKVVVINSFFTTCTSVCPPMNRNFEKVQDALGDRLGKEAFLVSISVDPETDTPPRLKEYSRRFHAREGWIFLTGKKENVDWALYKLGQYVETKDDHSTIIIIGNEPKGLWKKAFGLANPDELVKIVEDVINDR
ncbi:MAG TPA: SCO family protein [Pyrinomonadaceae bacterium]|nr:SCO family protein [Pyrinomonadaceae bacterium]